MYTLLSFHTMQQSYSFESWTHPCSYTLFSRIFRARKLAKRHSLCNLIDVVTPSLTAISRRCTRFFSSDSSSTLLPPRPPLALQQQASARLAWLQRTAAHILEACFAVIRLMSVVRRSRSSSIARIDNKRRPLGRLQSPQYHAETPQKR